MHRHVSGIPLNALLQAAFPGRDNPVLVVGWKNRRILAANECVERVFGYRPEELQDRTTEMLHVDRHSFIRFGEMTEAALAADKDSFHGYYRMMRRDGTEFDCENLVNVVRDQHARPVAAVSVVRDLASAHPLGPDPDSPLPSFQVLSRNLPGAVFERVKKRDGAVVYGYMHGNLGKALGLSGEQAQRDARHLHALIDPTDRERMEASLDRTPDGGASVDLELRARTAGDEPRWLRCIAQAHRPDDGSLVWDGILLDITAQKEAEHSLHHLASYDGLTGLPNTATFDERLADAIAEARRTGRRLVVAELDIDRFHAINESLGFSAGDQALRQVGERLTSVAFGNDLVARFQGDEFLILRQDVGSNEELVGIAQQLVSLFDEPLRLDGDARFLIRPRLGLSVFPEDGATPDALRRSADLALQRARKSKSAGYAFYSVEMTREVLTALELEGDLREAIQQRRIVPYYQLQFDATGTRITGIEALARWVRGDGEPVSPAHFIPLAEETGLIHQLGQLLVEQVLADVVAWRGEGRRVPPVSFNVSAHQARNPGFFEWFLERAAQHRLGPEHFTVEVTESAFLLDFDGTREIMNRMARRGVRFSIDDFGTGFSSLSYLSQLPFQELKIDRSFVADIEVDPARRAVTRGIIDLGHALNLSVLAEGVETGEQLTALSRMGCDAVQGYYLARPVAAEAVAASLARVQDGR